MEKINTADRIAQIIIEQLDKGTSPWHKSWKGIVPRSIDGRKYRGINTLLLGCLPYKCPRYLTFKKCSELGGNVKKGARGHLVMFWNRVTKEEKDEKTGEVSKKSFMLVKGYTVFNVAQCEGLPEKYYKMDGVKEHQPIAEAEKIWEGYEDKPQTVFTKGDSAFYMPSCDVINVPEMGLFESAEEFYATLFHEGVHSTGHEKRLNRGLHNGFGSEPYGKEELTAEIGAQLLCQMCGIERTLDNTVAYCKSWAKALRGMKSTEIIKAAARAQKAVDYMTGVKFEKGE